MGLSDLPPELRYKIYIQWFAGRVFRPARPLDSFFRQYDLCEQHWLSDAFLINKAISHDPWLSLAIIRSSIFHVDLVEDVQLLQDRFGAASLQDVMQISLGRPVSDELSIHYISSLMPKLNHFQLPGNLSPMRRVWNRYLEDFYKHPWAQFVACLCVFAPGRVPGPESILTEYALAGTVELVVHFVWEDSEYGTRKMQFSTKDWMLRYQHHGAEFALKQVRPENLQTVLDEAKGLSLQ